MLVVLAIAVPVALVAMLCWLGRRSRPALVGWTGNLTFGVGHSGAFSGVVVCDSGSDC